MTIAEMRQKRSEIDTRREAIEKRKAEVRELKLEDMEGAEVEKLRAELEGYAAETTALNNEYINLINEETRAMSTATEFTPVIAAETAPANDRMARRQAFQSFVATGKADPLLRATTTGNVTSVIIPEEITNRLFKVDAHYGSIYARVTKTTYNAGINIPIGNFSPEVEWVEERAVAGDSDADTTYIAFTNHKAQVKVPISLEVSVMALPEFEDMIVSKIQEAFMKEFDSVIIAGNGTTQPQGIINSGKGQTYEMADATKYANWVEAYSLVPMSELDNIVLVINRADFVTKLLGMVDDSNRPIATWTVGFGNTVVPQFMGHDVIFVENQGLSTMKTGGVCALFVNLADYILNFNKTLQMKTYTDENTDDLVYKATCLADGKLVDGDSLVMISV